MIRDLCYRPGMASKRAKTDKTDDRARVVDAALALAAARDWGNVTLADIAQEAGLTLPALARMFETREDILTAYARRIDVETLPDRPALDSPPRDALFDALMDRFERLNRDRDAVTSIMSGFCADPKQMVISLPQTGRSMSLVLEGCGIETLGWRGCARVAGLSAIYLYILRVWREDDTQDLSKTMAALDRALDRTERWAATLGF